MGGQAPGPPRTPPDRARKRLKAVLLLTGLRVRRDVARPESHKHFTTSSREGIIHLPGVARGEIRGPGA